MSPIQRSSSSRPAATFRSRAVARFSAASGSAIAGASPVVLAAAASARADRPSSQVATSADSSDIGSAVGSEAATRPSASPCLHGNLRDGQEHLKAGPARSMQTEYGSLPDPWHFPKTARSLRPRSDHSRRATSPAADRSTAGSVDSARTWSGVGIGSTWAPGGVTRSAGDQRSPMRGFSVTGRFGGNPPRNPWYTEPV